VRMTRPVPIAENLRQIAELEAEAVRITRGPAGRCFAMPNGRLITVANEQPPNSDVLHFQAILLLSREDAEDFYGWTPD
jgi:hypothetical protein